MVACMLPLDVSIVSTLTPGAGRARALRPGDGASMADRPARVVLKPLGTLRLGAAFRCRLTHALGHVLTAHDMGSVLVALRYQGDPRTVVQKYVDCRVLVEPVG